MFCQFHRVIVQVHSLEANCATRIKPHDNFTVRKLLDGCERWIHKSSLLNAVEKVEQLFAQFHSNASLCIGTAAWAHLSARGVRSKNRFMQASNSRRDGIVVVVNLEEAPRNVLKLGFGKARVFEQVAKLKQHLGLNTASNIGKVLTGDAL